MEETVVLYRNCGFSYPLVFQDDSGFPLDLTGYNFAWVIAPTQSNRTFGPPAYQNFAPNVSSGNGAVTFVMGIDDTASLSVTTAYEHIVLVEPPNETPQAKVHGRVVVKDAPPGII